MVTEMTDQMDLYVCLVCGYIYDPKVGDPKAGIPPRGVQCIAG